MEKRLSFKRIGLLPRIFIAIALGIALSFIMPDWATRIFVTFNSLFSNFLSLFVPLMIIGLVAPGIFEMGKGAGGLLLITVSIAYFSTILSGFFSYGVCSLSFESVMGNSISALGKVDMANTLLPYFTIDMPSFISVTTALVLSFVFGLTLIHIEGNVLRNGFREFQEVVTRVITKLIIPLLPIFIFGIFLQMGAEGKVGPIMGMFIKIILIIFAMHVFFLVFQFCIAGAVARKNPFKALWNMMPAYVTALGTQSSAATIPVTMGQCLKNGVKPQVASFTVPLCATVHLSCSILKIVACAYAISLSMGMDVSLSTYAGFILMLGITMVAAPGVPGGAIMAALGLLESMLGFDANMLGLMIALYITMDSFGTAGNVTGDGAIALIIDRISNKSEK